MFFHGKNTKLKYNRFKSFNNPRYNYVPQGQTADIRVIKRNCDVIVHNI